MKNSTIRAVISKTAEYALRAALHLARHDLHGPVRAQEIARALEIPPNYLSKILHILARSGTLVSERGPHGGFRLARPASELSMAEVLTPIEPLTDRRTCLFGRPECSDENPCPVHDRWKEVSEPVASFFRETTLQDLLGGAVSPVSNEKGGGDGGASTG